jgi:hypothetical protein
MMRLAIAYSKLRSRLACKILVRDAESRFKRGTPLGRVMLRSDRDSAQAMLLVGDTAHLGNLEWEISIG